MTLLLTGCSESDSALFAQTSGRESSTKTTTISDSTELGAYVLGPEDALSLKVINVDEIGVAPYSIDLEGNLRLPTIGSVHAGGLTVKQLAQELNDKFRDYIRHPDITITVTEFRSQPVSVLGAVGNPGIHQIRGRKTLLEVISEAGGLKPDAGNSIKITRRKEFGDVPLPGAMVDQSNQYSVAEINVRSVMRAEDPSQNIFVKPYDTVTVPKADLVYVIGDVKRPGGFPLTEKPTMSLLEALSLAEGPGRTAGIQKAKILRASKAGAIGRSEIPVNVSKILSGRSEDVPMLPNDILFIPTSGTKLASTRAIEAIIQIGTGVAVYPHF